MDSNGMASGGGLSILLIAAYDAVFLRSVPLCVVAMQLDDNTC